MSSICCPGAAFSCISPPADCARSSSIGMRPDRRSAASICRPMSPGSPPRSPPRCERRGRGLLATPWNFHADPLRFSGAAAQALALLADMADSVPVEAIQTLFFALDPFAAERKFIRFAGLDPADQEARSFVALEDWVNDGVPLASGVART